MAITTTKILTPQIFPSSVFRIMMRRRYRQREKRMDAHYGFHRTKRTQSSYIYPCHMSLFWLNNREGTYRKWAGEREPRRQTSPLIAEGSKELSCQHSNEHMYFIRMLPKRVHTANLFGSQVDTEQDSKNRFRPIIHYCSYLGMILWVNAPQSQDGEGKRTTCAHARTLLIPAVILLTIRADLKNYLFMSHISHKTTLLSHPTPRLFSLVCAFFGSYQFFLASRLLFMRL